MEKQWGERIVYRGKIMSSSREAEGPALREPEPPDDGDSSQP